MGFEWAARDLTCIPKSVGRFTGFEHKTRFISCDMTAFDLACTILPFRLNGGYGPLASLENAGFLDNPKSVPRRLSPEFPVADDPPARSLKEHLFDGLYVNHGALDSMTPSRQCPNAADCAFRPCSRLLTLADGTIIATAGLFLHADTAFSSPLVADLGLAILQGPTGPYLKTGPFNVTSRAGIFAAGDITRPAGIITPALADGAIAGTAAHQSLLWPDRFSPVSEAQT